MIWGTASINLIDVAWTFLASCFLVAFGLYKLSSQRPRNDKSSFVFVIFQDLIRYGKTKQNFRRDDWLRVFDVPKKWFWHFYALSVCWNGFLLLLYLNLIFQHQPLPSWLAGLLAFLTGVSERDYEIQFPEVTTVLVLFLLWFHSLRRLTECCFVSVFSDGVIHVAQYLFGLLYYIALGLTVLCSERLVRTDCGPLSSQINWCHMVGCALFVLASLLQHQSMVLLARLRTGKTGAVETLAHKLPSGGCFELVSCPHYFAELLIYISLCVVSGGLSFTWWLVVTYVFFNQALAAQLCHDLYKSKYESYPKQRKAFIPFML